MVIAPGELAPDFQLAAVASGKEVGPRNGRTTVLVLHGNKTQDAPKTVGKAVRAEHPDADAVLVANVVNLKPFGGLWKKMAEAQLRSTYERMAAKVGDKAPDFVVLLPDWDNSVGPLFGVADSDKQAAVVVLDAAGTVLASAQGDAEGLAKAASAALAGPHGG